MLFHLYERIISSRTFGIIFFLQNKYPFAICAISFAPTAICLCKVQLRASKNNLEGQAKAAGDNVTFLLPDGGKMLEQKIIQIDPKSRIETTFEPHFFGPDAPGSRMAYLIEPQGEVCKLTIEHYDLPAGQDGIAEGWARLAASLKSWLETGTALKVAG